MKWYLINVFCFHFKGRQYCFISNIDNLGATVDLRILRLLIGPEKAGEIECLMEVTDKTRADVKVYTTHFIYA